MQNSTALTAIDLEVGNEYVCLSSLYERGWTASLVRRFLNEPDKFTVYPRYRSASPMKLFAMDRVRSCELDSSWLAAKEKSAVRGAASRKVSAAKRDALLEQIDALEIRVKVVKVSALLDLSIKSYNDWHGDFDNFSPATMQSEDLFLQRIQVNYIRHHLTQYDKHLEQVAGKTAVHEAVRLIRSKVFSSIAKSYPQLLKECERQAPT